MEKRIQELESEIKDLQIKITLLENVLISRVPDWAEESLFVVKSKGEVAYPYIKPGCYGSYDYYRIITLLVKNNLI